MKDDHGRAKGGQRDVQAAACCRGLQLLGEVPQVSIRGIPKELEKVVVKTVGVGAVDDEVGDSEHLEQQTSSLALFGTVPQQPLCVDHDDFADGVEGGPHAHSAGLLRGRRLEHLPAHEESVVQGVGFALTRVAEDGHHFQQLLGVAAQALDEGCFIFYLGRGVKIRYKSDKTYNSRV